MHFTKVLLASNMYLYPGFTHLQNFTNNNELGERLPYPEIHLPERKVPPYHCKFYDCRDNITKFVSIV